MDEQQIKAVNTRNLLKKILLVTILVAAYQFMFTDRATPTVEIDNIKLMDKSQVSNWHLESGDKEDDSPELAIRFSLSMNIGKDLKTLIEALIASR